jgi:hypothetical protein
MNHPEITERDDKALAPVTRSDHKFNALNSPRHVKERVNNRIVYMLILSEPRVLVFFWEPDVNKRLIVNVDINIETVRKDVMSVVLMTPPLRTDSQKELAENNFQVTTNIASPVTIVMTKPSCLLNYKA